MQTESLSRVHSTFSNGHLQPVRERNLWLLCEALENRTLLSAIAAYDFGTTSAPVWSSADAESHSTATSFTPAAGLGSTGNWNSTNNGINIAAGNPAPEFAQKPISTTTQGGAYSGNAYWSFTVSPDSGYRFNLTDLSFDLAVANSARPISYYLASSVGGFANPIGAVVNNATGGTYSTKTFDLSGSSFQGLTGTVEFRLYVWSTAGGGSSGSRWGFDNVTLSGDTISTPVQIASYGFGSTGAPSWTSGDAESHSATTSFTPAAGLGSSGNWNSTTNGINIGNGNPAPEFAQKPISATTQAAAYSSNAYWSFTVSPDSGYQANLTTLSFDLAVANSARPISYYLASSVGGFANPIGAVANNVTGGAYATKTFDLSGSSFQNLSGTVEFRLYVWSTAGGGSSGSRWGFDNVTLNGTVSQSSPDTAYTNTNPFGVAASSYSYSQYATWLPQMASAGVKWARLFPQWGSIETADDTWDWSGVDAVVSAAQSNNMYLSAKFGLSPSWLGTGQFYLPVDHLTQWNDYVSHVVQHTSGQVAYWEVWNEPNTTTFATNGTPANYATLVTNTYDTAKAADPNVKVGLSVASFDVNWLERAIQAGAADHYDFIAIHPYEILGTVAQGNEAVFMNMVTDMRKMLAANDPDHADVPIWITEVGTEAGVVGETQQAEALLKTYTMSIAQGISRIEWYEAKDGQSSFGLVRSNGTTRPSYTAMQNMTSILGTSPSYVGWLQLNGADYGFVFSGASTSVLALWARPGQTDSVTFSSGVRILDPLAGTITNLAAGNALSLTNNVTFVLDVPSNLLSQAAANLSSPFPWDGDYTDASSVSLTAGSTISENGLHLLNASTAVTPVLVDGTTWALDCSASASQRIVVDPNFLSYTPTEIQITVVLRRVGADSAGFNMKYESTTGLWKNAGWYTIPAGTNWTTKTWTLTDDEFNSDWGYNLWFNSDSTANSKYYIQSITITKAGGGLMAMSPDPTATTAANDTEESTSASPLLAGLTGDLLLSDWSSLS